MAAGLARGSAQCARRPADWLRVYAWLELAAGLCALAGCGLGGSGFSRPAIQVAEEVRPGRVRLPAFGADVRCPGARLHFVGDAEDGPPLGSAHPLFKPPPPACSVHRAATSARYAARTSSGGGWNNAYGVWLLVSPFTSATMLSRARHGRRYFAPTPYWIHGV